VRTLLLVLAASLLSACGSVNIQPSSSDRNTPPARFDRERDDDLEDDLTLHCIPPRAARLV